jgi:hypothetical protein
MHSEIVSEFLNTVFIKPPEYTIATYSIGSEKENAFFGKVSCLNKVLVSAVQIKKSMFTCEMFYEYTLKHCIREKVV